MSDKKKSKYKVIDENDPEFKRWYPKGLDFEYDMTPIIDWDVISRIKVPEDRWFTDEEFRKIFVKAYGDGDPVLEKNQYDYLTGKISLFEKKERNLNHILYNHRDEGRKRYKATPELLEERKKRIDNIIKNIP